MGNTASPSIIRTKPNILPNTGSPSINAAANKPARLFQDSNIEVSVAIQLPDGTKCSAQECSLQMESSTNEYTAKSGEKFKIEPGSYTVKLKESNKLPITEHSLEHEMEVTRSCDYNIMLNKNGQEDKLINMC